MEHIIEIDFMRCCRAVFRRSLALLMALVLGLLAGFGISMAVFERENEYTAYSEVFLSEIHLVPSCAEYLKADAVTQRAAALLGSTYSVSQIDSLVRADYRDNVTANIPIIRISASSRDPEEAAAIVDAVTEAYIAELYLLTEPGTVCRLGSADNVELSYNAKKTCLLVTLGTGLALPLLLMAFIVLREILALRLSTVKDGLLGGQLKLIGVIPRYKE